MGYAECGQRRLNAIAPQSKDRGMLSQQKADNELLKVYGQAIAIVVLLLLLAIFGVRYLNNAPNLGARNLALEHNRFLNVLAMVRSQWLASGRPDKMLLSWHNLASNEPNSPKTETPKTATELNAGQTNTKVHNDNDNEVINDNNSEVINYNGTEVMNNNGDLMGTDNWITLSAQGWPIIDTYDAQGCERLWRQLLATDVQQLSIRVDYQADGHSCRYFSADKASLRYQLQTGRVIFLSSNE